MTVTTVRGETEPRDFQLKSNGANLNGTGYTVQITSKAPFTVAWLDQPNGTVRVSGAENAAVGRYPFRFALYKSGKMGYAPSEGGAGLWVVIDPLAVTDAA